MTENMTEILMREGHQAGIDLIGVTDAEDIECVPWTYPEKEEHYFPCRASWIKENTYSPKKIMAEAKAVIVTAMYMYGYDKIKESIKGFPRANIGPWTRGYVEARDYAAGWITKFIEAQGYAAVVSNEIPYRTLAVKAGLGKIGRNGFLYHDAMGSYLNLCCILTDAPLKCVNYGTVSPENNCGNCKKCSAMCPTGALRRDGSYHAELCLHLWQQGKGMYGEEIPREERHKCLNYLMRTGRCLEVCPRNSKLKPRESFPFESEEKEDSPLLEYLILASDKEYRERLPYHVYKYGIKAIRRDIIIAAGNSKDEILVDKLGEGLLELDEKCRGLCAWALGEIGGNKAEKWLAMAYEKEEQKSVRQEIEYARRKTIAGKEDGYI